MSNQVFPDQAPMPEIDAFNTPEAYIIHAIVPGAKKSDLNVTFESGSSTVKISGVINRPDEVDEQMMESFIQRERRVGYFERTVELDRDAKVESDDMIAKLEDGILRVYIPKVGGEEWTDIRKVQIE